MKSSVYDKGIENPSRAPHGDTPGSECGDGRRHRREGSDIARAIGRIGAHELFGLCRFALIGFHRAVCGIALAGQKQKIFAVCGIRVRDNFETCRMKKTQQGACGEMIEMLVDEPFLDDVVRTDQGDIGHVDKKQPARLERSPMIGEHACGRGEMLQRVTGMDNIETRQLERGIFNPYTECFAPRKIAAALRDALVRLDGHQRRMRSSCEKRMREAAAIGAHIEHRQFAGERDMPFQQGQRLSRAEGFSVTHIAPVGAT